MSIHSRLKGQISRYYALVRLSPFDCSTPEGRSKERYRRIALSSLVSALGRGVTIITSLVTVPLTVKYLGPERYGMWMTASSVIVLLGFADFGIGNGLINAISESDGQEDRKKACEYTSSAFFMFLGIAALIICLFVAIYNFVPWSRVFNVHSSSAAQEAGPTMAVFIFLTALNMPLGVAQRVQMGYQEGYKTNLWGVGGSLLGLAGVLLAIHLQAGLPWLVFAMAGSTTIAMLANWLFLFTYSRKWLFPSWNTFNYAKSRRIVGTGIYFLILQLMALVGGLPSDNMVITQVLGASAVAAYAVTQKLFIGTMVAQYFIAPLWPAFGEAIGRKDYAWARKTLNKAMKLGMLTSALTAVPFFLFGKQLVLLWVGPTMVPSFLLLGGFASFVFLATYGGVMSTFLNHGELMKKQVVFYSVASITALLLKVILVSKINIAGAIWATVLGYSVFYTIPAARLAYRWLKENEAAA